MADATILYNGPLSDTATWLAVMPNTVSVANTWMVITANGLGLIIVKEGA